MLLPGTIANASCCLIFGKLFDAGLQPRYLMAFAGCAAATYSLLLSIVSIAPSESVTMLMVVAGITKGVCGAGLSTCQGVIYATYFGRTHLGAISSIDKVGMVSGSAFGPLMFGVARTWFGGWPFYLRCLCMLPLSLATIDVLFLRAPPPPIRAAGSVYSHRKTNG